MNRKINIFAIGFSLLALVVMAAVPVYAHTDQETPASNNQIKTTQLSEQQTTGDDLGQEAETRAQRLEKRKQTFKTKLTGAQKARLQSRCKNSQGLLRSLEGRIKGIETSRSQVYSNLVDRLTKLSEKLKAKGLDTVDLDAHIVTLQEKIEVFNTDLANYKQAVTDLAEMDCAADAEAFKASLEEARALRQTLSDSGQDIKTFVKDTVKAALMELRKQLQSTTDTSEDSNDEQNEGGDE